MGWETKGKVTAIEVPTLMKCQGIFKSASLHSSKILLAKYFTFVNVLEEDVLKYDLSVTFEMFVQ